IHPLITRESKWRYIMKKVNLRDLYPDVYKTDAFLEVTDEVQAVFQSDERAEAAYERKMYRYMKKRKEFNRMITACKRGVIDLILTKSLSRFARNTVDCLETVRMLKARGIGVIFEKENINSLTESSEFLITLFSGFAQAESESLSSNIHL